VVEVYRYTDAVPLTEFARDTFYNSYYDSPIDFRIQLIKLAVHLLTVVGTLNALGIFHKNISPDNILVQFDRRRDKSFALSVNGVRLRNFDASCALLTAEAAQLIDDAKLFGKNGDSTTCVLHKPGSPEFEYKYEAKSKQWRDPASILDAWYYAYSPKDLAKKARELVLHQWPKLETFACGAIIQWLVDRDQLVSPNAALQEAIRKQHGAMVPRVTERSFAGLKSILAAIMSEDLDKRLSSLAAAARFKAIEQLLYRAKQKGQEDSSLVEVAPASAYDERKAK
jgi:hypothetical protein